ncbi:hypothetical protein BD309DRAFT_670837 [Dichomitus squalens]|uniref:Uncharacterized protein n=1 Tax=Dichomitus squalens TaxID=114155 RepID=A0A4Q9PFB9_9APHY|nr:hypothetical protein BD309DRAFT_670837 [Dichomitus squalens]TBU53508.1 hypothetical protein BD310DRAFT_937881 [Dichomitus squalens]
MEGPDDVPLDPTPASLVRNLWLGPTSSIDQNDLDYGSNAWPITLIHQILTRCTALRALAVVCIGQARWYRLTGVIPASVTSLWLGPVHGELDYKHLPCAPNLRYLTSLDTFMLDTEVRDLVLSPSIAVLRRVYSSADRVTLAFDQLECVQRATVLERLDIVCCGKTEEEAKGVLEETANRYEFDRDRVALVPVSSYCDGRRDVIAVLFGDWAAHVRRL